jgi:flagellar basal-body rod protein FlgF
MVIGAERRIDVAAANVSNMNTPGYRPHRIFSSVLDSRSGIPQPQDVLLRSNPNAALTQTGSPLDFASSSDAVFALQSPAGTIFTRSLQLRRDGDGRLVDAQGRALLAADGRELVVSSGTPTVLADGTVIVEGQPQGRIGLFDASRASGAGGSVDLPDLASGASVKQGMVVGSEVELSDEMIELNKATRMAETGAKLFQLQDDLLAKAASQLGSIGK